MTYGAICGKINKEDINDFSITKQEKPAGTITAEQIIFIKHLFYKQKMEVTIDNEEKCSIQNWLVKYLDKLCKGLGIKKDDIPEYVFEHAFDYSVIELKEICDKDGNDINIKFNDIDADFNEYYFTAICILYDGGKRVKCRPATESREVCYGRVI